MTRPSMFEIVVAAFGKATNRNPSSVSDNFASFSKQDDGLRNQANDKIAKISQIGGGIFVKEIIRRESLLAFDRLVANQDLRGISRALFEEQSGLGSVILAFPLDESLSCLRPILEEYEVDPVRFSNYMNRLNIALQRAQDSIFHAEQNFPRASLRDGKDCQKHAHYFVESFRNILPEELLGYFEN
ncbi:MAG: hypothetical protein GYA55_01730 [SAR324 cluster bacterium]|uniref:Uncharacterized protein n=1 Tax=SAR324 cluster bacterium TaxID=2024889 RepID=A0A7X9FPC8_9DELT|nr:hypothetical protein [SAR324 cluster bacterium]